MFDEIQVHVNELGLKKLDQERNIIFLFDTIQDPNKQEYLV